MADVSVEDRLAALQILVEALIASNGPAAIYVANIAREAAENAPASVRALVVEAATRAAKKGELLFFSAQKPN